MAKGKVTVFIAHSFAPRDSSVVGSVKEVIRAAGMDCVTGEPPEATTLADKVRRRIARADLFVAVMTRRHRAEGTQDWTTSPWVVEEKGYSLGQRPGRPIIPLVEEGIPVPAETGGLGGDAEVIFFTRPRFAAAEEKLRQMLAALQL
jgi:hypothetical protein